MRRAGLSYSTIADAIDLSANTVKSLCRRENMDVANDEKHDVCNYCGIPLTHHPGKKKKRFCNDKCRSDWWNHNRKWAGRKKLYCLLCHCCGAEFNSYGNKKRKYCGRECYIRGRYDQSPAGREGVP
jgi:hypothetical protein